MRLCKHGYVVTLSLVGFILGLGPFEKVRDFVESAEKAESLSNGSRIKYEFDQCAFARAWYQ